MKKITWSAFLLIFLFLIFAGCTPLISKQLGKELSPDITFKQVVKDADKSCIGYIATSMPIYH